MHLANLTGDVASDDISLSAAVFAGLSACVYRAMEQGCIKAYRGIRNKAAVSSNGSRDIYSVACR